MRGSGLRQPSLLDSKTCSKSVITAATAFALRSEERRVGKECRSLCDWSSDVCSSDLTGVAIDARIGFAPTQSARFEDMLKKRHYRGDGLRLEIGRASCRERV